MWSSGTVQRTSADTLTGNFSVDSVDVVLSQIALAMDVSIHRDGRNVVVR